MSGYEPGRPPPFAAGHDAPSYPEQSQSTVVFVLGLLGILVFPPLAPFVWAMGRRELAAIDAGRRPPENRQMAQIGQILGIVMSVLLMLFVLVVFLLIGFAFAAAFRF